LEVIIKIWKIIKDICNPLKGLSDYQKFLIEQYWKMCDIVFFKLFALVEPKKVKMKTTFSVIWQLKSIKNNYLSFTFISSTIIRLYLVTTISMFNVYL